MADISFDDLIPTKQQSRATTESNVSFDDLVPKDAGALSAFGSGAATGVVPGLTGLAGFGAGMKASVPVALRAAAAFPVPHPLAKAAVGGGVALLGGFAGAMGAGGVASIAQDMLYELVDPEGYAKNKLAQAQHPTAYGVGNIVGSSVGMSPKVLPEIAGRVFSKPVVQRGTSAVLGGGINVAQQAMTKDHIDWTEAAAATGVGAALPSFNRLGSAAFRAGERLVPVSRRPIEMGIGPRDPELEVAPDIASRPPESPIPAKAAEATGRIDANLREAELSTDPGKRLKEAAFKDTSNNDTIIPQGKGHDDLLKTDPRLEQGFLTEDNTFVTRQEAKIIAENQHSDLLTKGVDPKEGFHSTDFGPERMDALKGKDFATFDSMQPGESITLYRGETKENEAGGQWWTTDPNKAAKYGKVEQVTLTSETIGKHAAQGHGGPNEFVFPTEGKRPSDLVKLEPKSVAQELGIRNDSRSNFFEDVENYKLSLLDKEQKLDSAAASMSQEDLIAANSALAAEKAKLAEASKEVPQLIIKDKQKATWKEIHDVLAGAKTIGEGIDRLLKEGVGSRTVQLTLKILGQSKYIRNADLSISSNVKLRDGEPTLGEYISGGVSKSHEVRLYGDSGLGTFIHEAFHAGAQRLLDTKTSEAAKELIKIFKKFEAIGEGEYQTKLKQHLVDNPNATPFELNKFSRENRRYGLTNVHEFVSEALSNHNFKQFLSEFKSDGSKGVTSNLWKDLKNSIYDGLGVPRKDRTALDDVLGHTETLLKESENFTRSELDGRSLPSKGPAPSEETVAPAKVDPKRYDPRNVVDEADLKIKGKELYAAEGADAARKFFTDYETYRDTWLNPVKEVEDFVEININNKMADERIVINNSNVLKALVPDAVAREQVAIAIDAKNTKSLTGAAKEAADKYTGWMKDIGERALKEGVVKGLLENYVTHIVNWKDLPKGALDTFLADVFGKKFEGEPSGMTPESRFGKERTVETFHQLDLALKYINERIEAAGKSDFRLEVKTKDIAEIYKQYASSMEKAIENKKLVDSVRQIRNVKGESLVRRITEEDPLPRGWTIIDDRQFAGFAVHPDLAPALKFAFEAKGGMILNALYNISQITKRLNVVASLFHAKSLMEVLNSTHTPIVTPIKEVVLGITDKSLGTELSGIRKAINEFRTGGLGSSIDLWLRGGLVLETPGDVSKGAIAATGKFADSMISKFGPKTHTLESGLTATEKYTLGVFDKVTWDYLHTGGKLMTAEAYLTKAREQATKDGVPFDEAAARKEIISFVNKSFGGLNWFQEARSAQTEFGKRMAMAAYSPEGRKVLQILLFAPDWTISTIKAFTSALPKGFNPTKWHPIEGVKGMGTPSTQADYARLYQFKTALTYLTLINGINLITANHSIWDNKDPTRIEWPDGTSMQAMKHAMEPYHWLADPTKTLSNKLGFVPKSAVIGLTGSEYASPSAPKLVDPSLTNRAIAIGKQALPFQISAAMSAPEGEGAKRAVLGTIGLPLYGQTVEQRKIARKERSEAVRVQREKYRERERTRANQ